LIELFLYKRILIILIIMIKYLLSFLYLINIANAFGVSFPGIVKNKAIIKNINVKNYPTVIKKN
jgi:hypothetical protein